MRHARIEVAADLFDDAQPQSRRRFELQVARSFCQRLLAESRRRSKISSIGGVPGEQRECLRAHLAWSSPLDQLDQQLACMGGSPAMM